MGMMLRSAMGGGLRMGMGPQRPSGGTPGPSNDNGKMDFSLATQSALIALLEDI